MKEAAYSAKSLLDFSLSKGQGISCVNSMRRMYFTSNGEVVFNNAI